MCGIAGIYGKSSPELIERMLDSIAHRGPDGRGNFSDERFRLGHARLAIIDITDTGRQPMFNEDRSLVLAVNGEIYNAPELRDELTNKGHVFRSTSDSEVVLHLYEEHGFTEAVRALNGMFAIILYDTRSRKLFMARDRLGIKQLYYRRQPGRLIFASEIKAILQDPEVPRRLNPEALYQYLAFRNILNDSTFFQGIQVMLPGTIIEYDGTGFKQEQFWQPEFHWETGGGLNDFDAVCGAFREKTRRAVGRHLLSDVPLGTYLSGGFDSSTVSFFASKLLRGEMDPGRFTSYPSDRELPSFTGKFAEGKKYDETPCARAVARDLGLNLSEVSIGPKDFTDNFRNVIYHLDEPRVGVGSFSQFMVAREVARNVKVVLTGHGGDEFFSGYPVLKVRMFLDRLKDRKAQALRLLAGFRPSEFAHLAFFGLLPLLYPERKDGLFILFDRGRRNSLISPRLRQEFSRLSTTQFLEESLQGFSGNNYQRLEWLYIKTYLSALFIVEDKISMAHSLEARTPLCDNEMIDFAMSIPDTLKIHERTLKAIPKGAMRGKLPELLYSQPKKGFPTPLARWIRGPLRELFRETLSESAVRKSGIFSPKEVDKTLNRLLRSPFDTPRELVLANRLWAIANVLTWQDLFSVSA